MWRNAPVVLLLVLCWAVAPSHPANMDEGSDICAMTEVLAAMKELLVLLSTEIRDLRQQVKNSCQPTETVDVNATVCPSAEPEPVGTDEPVLEVTSEPLSTVTSEPLSTVTSEPLSTVTSEPLSAVTSDVPNATFTFEVEVEEKEKEDDYGLEDAEENTVSEVIEGLTSWWENFSPFAPKPTTDATSTAQPGDADKDDEEGKGDGDTPTEIPKPKTTTTTTTTTTSTTTTTTTTPLPYTLPPAPTSCPSPYQLLAEGCYLVVHDSREWRSWGEAYAFCQSYHGTLAAPWRLPQLQKFLSRYYSDAFWVGARFVPAKRKWEWLTDRSVEQGEWRPGQPHRNPGRKCVFLDKWSGYRANNYFCGEKYPFLCESREA